MISKAFDYALRAMVYMAHHNEQEKFGVIEIAEKTKVSRTYLGKILQQLVRDGFLTSVTGPRGGFSFARPPEKITLLELLTAIEGDTMQTKCFLGLSECSDTNPCPVHPVWKKNRTSMVSEFRKLTIADSIKKSWPQYR